MKRLAGWIITLVLLGAIFVLIDDSNAPGARERIRKAPAPTSPDRPVGAPALAHAALALVWDQRTDEARAQMCSAWSIRELRPALLDRFMAGTGGAVPEVPDRVMRRAARRHFNDECGA